MVFDATDRPVVIFEFTGIEAQLLGYMNHHIFRDIFRFCWETAFMLKIFQQNGLPQLIVRGVPAEQA